MMKPTKLKISSVSLRSIAEERSPQLVVAAFGYEERASRVCEDLLGKIKAARSALVDFQDLRDGYGRSKNDTFLKNCGLPTVSLQSNEYGRFENHVIQEIFKLRTETNKPVVVHLDYSCMPRIWYCRLTATLVGKLSGGDTLYLWYTPGKYNEKAFAPSGIDQFDVFSGQASLTPPARTHILGLGFEGVRAQAILSVIDPEYLVCYFADPGVDQEYVKRAKEANKDLLNTAQQFLTLPLPDFATSFERLRSVVQEYRVLGDVILIPDGPKPLVLATSLIPLTTDQPGVTCLHVRRRVRAVEAALNVEAAAEPYGAKIAI